MFQAFLYIYTQAEVLQLIEIILRLINLEEKEP